MRILGFLAGGIAAVSVLIGSGIWMGLSLSTALENRFSFPSQISYKLNGMYNSIRGESAATDRRVISNRVILREETVYLPLSATDFAGGISTIGDETVLVIDRVGKLFSVSGTDVQELALQTPDNRVDALRRQLNEGLLGDIEVDFNWFRYNDILPVKYDGVQYLLASYSEWDPDALCFVSALARIALVGSDPVDWQGAPDDWEVITRTQPCLAPFTSGKGIFGLEAGGRLQHLRDSRVIWTSGSYERDDRVKGQNFAEDALAQSPDTDYGRVMEIDVLSGDIRHLAKGLRNPQGVTIDAEGRIWVSDHGMRGGDELNLVTEGANFGFPVVTYGTRYNRAPAGNRDFHTNHDGFDKPVAAFVPSIAPSSVLAVEDFHYAWDGDVIVGALSGGLHRVHVEEGRTMYIEEIPLGIRVRDLDLLPNGKIVLWSDDRRVVLLSPDTAPDPTEEYLSLLAHLAPTPAVGHAASESFGSCLQCHGMLAGEVAAGPTLHAVCGREPGAADFDGYSGALNAIGGEWTEEKLASFFHDPTVLAPETSMGWYMENIEAANLMAKALCQM